MVRTPGTTLAQADSSVYGRRSLASLPRLASGCRGEPLEALLGVARRPDVLALAVGPPGHGDQALAVPAEAVEVVREDGEVGVRHAGIPVGIRADAQRRR